MTIRYICLDDKYLLPDPEWSYRNDGDVCYVRADDYQRVCAELDEVKAQLRYLTLSSGG